MSHLTAAERGKIEILSHQKHSLKTIADHIGVNKSTISRELARGQNEHGIYKAELASKTYYQNRLSSKQTPILDQPQNIVFRNQIVELLKSGWDPSNIAGRLKTQASKLRVCSETIYAWIYNSSWAIENKIYQYLRYGRKKRQTHGISRKKHRSKIPNRVSIHDRPKKAKNKKIFGHWEGDSVIYNNKHAINTLNERASSWVCFTKLTRKTADATASAVIDKLADKTVHSLTFDNGTEFCAHEKISKATGIQIFFADTYCSWQRGANENLNRQLRRFLPKKSDIDHITQQEIDEIANTINNKPRKRLNWLTPNEVHNWLTQNPGKKLNLNKVAFETRI